MRGKIPVTQFGRMCQKLGIRIILLLDETQHSVPKFRGFTSIGNSTHIAMLQPLAALFADSVATSV